MEQFGEMKFNWLFVSRAAAGERAKGLILLQTASDIIRPLQKKTRK